MARDLSASPWRSAAIAPLVTPLAMAVVGMSGALLEGRAIRPRDLAADVEVFLFVWLVAYLYMWILAVPTMLITRRWMGWSWIRLVFLGAFLGALPWIVGIGVSVAGMAGSRSNADLWRDFLRSIFVADDFLVVKFGAIGSLVAAVFCVLQLYVFRAPSNNALEQTREG
jgi:hypothetical protein